jgi:hypothetical protein
MSSAMRRFLPHILLLLTQLALIIPTALVPTTPAFAQTLVGMEVVPHNQASALRWRRAPDPDLAARVQLFIHNAADQPLTLSADQPATFDGHAPEDLLTRGQWAWHSTPSVWLSERTQVAPGDLTVLEFNGRAAAWGLGTQHQVQLGANPPASFTIDAPTAWLSAVTFLGTGTSASDPALAPDQIVVHLQNDGETDLRVQSLRIWLPPQDANHHVYRLAREYRNLDHFSGTDTLPPHARGGFTVSVVAGNLPHNSGDGAVDFGPLPLTYAVLEVQVEQAAAVRSLWTRLRIKRDVFDISGGWIASDLGGRNSLTIEEYLKTLARMHINTGQIEEVGGYTDNRELYTQYPIKRFNRLQNLAHYDSEALLPMIHAVEFIGEPQYGGGRPVPPQEVYSLLAPYQSSRLPTSVTLSEERNWRYYSGLSDFPHYDAYRVIAPAADAWGNYDRWGGDRIRWGAPLETIGDMTRSLRELTRPRPIAYWSQGAHDGWGGFLSPRRASPTPDELRAQAWQGLSNRVTSLYWFNLSLKSLVKFPDLIDPITRVNREIRMLDEILLRGDAVEYQRVEDDGQPAWDLNSIAAPDAALLVVHDLAYRPDPQERVFRFEPRRGEFTFRIPEWLQAARELSLFRVDADGVHDVPSDRQPKHVTIRDQVHVVGLYVLTRAPELRSVLQQRRDTLFAGEQAVGFDPAANPEDLQRLRDLLPRR